MKKAVHLICLIVLTAGMAGCTSTDAYFVDRGRDAADIFTATIGNGGGVTTRAGFVHAGLFFGEDKIGLRAGEFGLNSPITCMMGETDDPLIVLPNVGGGPWLFWGESYSGGLETVRSPRGGIMNLAKARGKDYYVSGNCPFIAIPVLREIDRNAGFHYPVYFLTEVEVAVGIVKTIRLGFNLGEFLDFIIGWTTIDIFNDDIGEKALKIKSNKETKAIQ